MLKPDRLDELVRALRTLLRIAAGARCASPSCEPWRAYRGRPVDPVDPGGATGVAASLITSSPGDVGVLGSGATFSARFAARRSALARALSFSFISRSRFANDGRWLDMNYLLRMFDSLRIMHVRPGGTTPRSAESWSALRMSIGDLPGFVRRDASALL